MVTNNALQNVQVTARDPGDYFKDSSVARSYDAYIEANVPFYRSSIGTCAGIIEAHGNRVRRDLELIEFGPGTGNLTLDILARARVGQYCVVDHSRPMLDLLMRKARDAGLNEQALVPCEAAMLDPAWERAVADGTLDAALFHLALDHVAEDHDLDRLLLTLNAKLARSGMLLIAEKCADGRQRGSVSWRSFAKMVDHRFGNMVALGLKSRAEAEAWRHHLLVEDMLRPLGSLWSVVEASGFEVVSAHGTKLPHPDRMTYETFYGTRTVQPISRESAHDPDGAFGIAILACRKVS